MASQWHSLISQKVFLARTLLDQAENTASAPAREALVQGAVELALRARNLVLVMITRLYQEKQARPGSIAALRELLGEGIPEVAELEQLAGDSGSWWGQLEMLEKYQGNPPAPRKTVSDENVIAVSADPGPDRSKKTIEKTLYAIKQFTDTLEERHSEW